MPNDRPSSAPPSSGHSKLHRPRPASAGFVGAFRAVVRRGNQPIRPPSLRGDAVKSSKAAPCRVHRGERNGSLCTELAPSPSLPPSESFDAARSKDQRPRSAPNARRSDCEKAKRNSKWALLANYAAHCDKELSRLQTQAKRKLVEEQKEDLRLHQDRQVRERSRECKRRSAERHMMQQICQADAEHFFEEKQKSIRQRLDVKAALEGQVHEYRQRRRKEKAVQIHEDKLAAAECARLAAQDQAEKLLAKERKRQEDVQVAMELIHQSRLKKQATNEMHNFEKQLAAEYTRTITQQQLARDAHLQEMSDKLARRMAANETVQEQQRAVEKAADSRFERLMQERHAQDDSKLQKEYAERQHSLEQFAVSCKEQLDHKKLLEQRRCEEEKVLAMELRAQYREDEQRAKVLAVARRSRFVEHQHDLLKQISEQRAHVQVDMSDAEQQMNSASLKMAMHAVSSPCSPA